MDISPEIQNRIELLAEKYRASGQELLDFLDGLLYADYLTYWDYIHLDTLLSLQTPRTNIPDEEIFIMYHQVTELYFKLCLHEIKQVEQEESLTAEFLRSKVERINRYFGALTHSFGIMVKGMDRQQFLKFRMSLIPASGFQSAQYRMIEIGCTDFHFLVDKEAREQYEGREASIEEMYTNIYWKKGAIVEKTEEKTLTLRQFEKKYSEKLIRFGNRMEGKNIWQAFLRLSPEEQQNDTLRAELRRLDQNVNINWPLQHYKSAVTYLAQRPHDIRATGGTNWQRYLPPRFQKRIFYPALWTAQEIEEWGKSWVEEALSESR